MGQGTGEVQPTAPIDTWPEKSIVSFYASCQVRNLFSGIFLKSCRGCIRNTFGIYEFKKKKSEVIVWMYHRMKQFKALKLRLAWFKWKMIDFSSAKPGNLTCNCQSRIKEFMSFFTVVVKTELPRWQGLTRKGSIRSALQLSTAPK